MAAPGCERAAGAAGVVMFLHGGFWRAAWDRTHAGPLAVGLAEAGFTVCLPEYRRTGGGGGWPATFDDIAAAIDTLPDRLGDSPGVVLAGHSAGGHLSLWAAARHRLPAGTPWRTAGPAPIRGVVALAAVSDLTACADEGLGGGAAAALMGGSPAAEPDRYARADPARLLPIGVPVWLLHGDRDDRVPAPMSRSFAARARAAGDEVRARGTAGLRSLRPDRPAVGRLARRPRRVPRRSGPGPVSCRAGAVAWRRNPPRWGRRTAPATGHRGA